MVNHVAVELYQKLWMHLSHLPSKLGLVLQASQLQPANVLLQNIVPNT